MGIAARGGDLTQEEMGELETRHGKFMREVDLSGAMLPGAGIIGQVGARTRTPAAQFLRRVLKRGMRRFRGPEREILRGGVETVTTAHEMAKDLLWPKAALLRKRKAVGLGKKVPGVAKPVVGRITGLTKPVLKELPMPVRKGLLPDVSKWEDLGQALRSSFELGARHTEDKAFLAEAYKKGLEIKTKVVKMLAKPRTKAASAQMYEEGLRGQFYREVLEGADKAAGKPFMDYQALWKATIEGAM